MLVVPENMQTGSPPLLKCGLAARATDESAANNATAVAAMMMRVRVRIVLKSSFVDASVLRSVGRGNQLSRFQPPPSTRRVSRGYQLDASSEPPLISPFPSAASHR